MPYLLFLKKQQNLKLLSAAKYRWRFKGLDKFESCPNGVQLTCKLRETLRGLDKQMINYLQLGKSSANIRDNKS